MTECTSRTLQFSSLSRKKILGDFNGYTVVEAQPISILTGAQRVMFNTTVTYYDYSTDGKLFMGGKVTFNGTWAEVNNITLPVDLRIDGGIAYAGDFSGTVEFINFNLGIDLEGALIPAGTPGTGFPAEGSVIIVSSDNQLTVNPYPVR